MGVSVRTPRYQRAPQKTSDLQGREKKTKKQKKWPPKNPYRNRERGFAAPPEGVGSESGLRSGLGLGLGTGRREGEIERASAKSGVTMS